MKKILSKLSEWQKRGKEGGVCDVCKRHYQFLSVDLIVPVYLLVELGLAECATEDEENFRLTCVGCNRMKSSQLAVLDPRTLPLLKKYILLSEQKFSLIHRRAQDPA